MTKPINFRPKINDVPIIELLMQTNDYKNHSDLVRHALWYLAISKFGTAAIDDVSIDIAERLKQMYITGEK